MSVIWKSKIYLTTCDLPDDARLLYVAEQDEEPHVWFETSGSLPSKPSMRIAHAVTGGQVPEGRYLGTVLLNGGGFVLHYYDREPKS